MVEIIDETSRFPHVPELERILAALLAELGLAKRDTTVVLVSDETIAGYNEQHRGVQGPTDVLSYPTFEPDDELMPTVVHLGDVLISVDTAARQAGEQGHDLLDEVLTLAAHGITHLRGYDHHTEEEWAIFRETQQRALALRTAS